MKKRLIITLVLAILITLVCTACQGQLAVNKIEITEGLKTEYALNEKPDFSSVKAVVTYNDGSAKSVTASELTFSELDTSRAGTKLLTITYDGYALNVSITVKGASIDSIDPSSAYTVFAHLPESLALWNTNKAEFKNQNYPYVIGDDNNFYFTLKLTLIDNETKKKTDITSYTSVSTVTLTGEDESLKDEELAKFVTIDEEKNAFDFTEAAIGRTFTITTRPKDYEDQADKLTKSLTVMIVDGYNIYKAYELNYITNCDHFDFTETNPDEQRNQIQIVDDFLKNEKNVLRPENINGIVIHNNLTIERTDIPSEYFLDRNRNNDLYEYISIFLHQLTESHKTFTLNGNFFAIYSHKLPCVVPEDVGNQEDFVSNAQLFRFLSAADNDKNYDHTQYVTNIKNLMLVDNDPRSDQSTDINKAMLGIAAIKTYGHVVNIDNVNIQAYYISLIAERDYHTINIKDSKFYNSFQNNIHLLSDNYIQASDDEPLSKEEYPRLTLNISNSSITQSGGPAIISQVLDATANRNKHAGAVVNISEDSLVEAWVTGDEAWFTALKLNYLIGSIKTMNTGFKAMGSSFITDRNTVAGGTMGFMNVVMVNLIVPDFENGDISGAINQVLGSGDIDGKLFVGNKTVMDMDDDISKGTTFGNSAVSDIKASNPSANVFATPSGGAGYLAGATVNVTVGSLAASEQNNYLALYYGSMAIIFGNYHKN